MAIIPMINAQAPFDVKSGLNGVGIEYSKQFPIIQGQDQIFHFHIYEITSGLPLTNATFNCSFHLYDNVGGELINNNNIDYETTEKDFYINVSSGNFSYSGKYSYVVACENGTIGGITSLSFDVNEAGIEMTEGRSLLSIGVLFIMCLFLFASLYSLFSIEDYRGKFALYWVSHVLIILITFIAWQIGVEGVLGGLAITGIFRVLFWVFLIATFPMVLLSIAWMFYIHTMNEHFEKLIKKGEDPETAFKLMDRKNKRRRW